MAKVQAVWIDGSADWNTPLDWNTGVVPDNSNTEVTLPTPSSPQSATYTVTISAGEEFTVNSVSITDPTATLAVDGQLVYADVADSHQHLRHRLQQRRDVRAAQLRDGHRSTAASATAGCWTSIASAVSTRAPARAAAA